MAYARPRLRTPPVALDPATDTPHLQGMYLAVLAYLVLTFFRVHEFVPVISILRPFQLITAIVFFLWLKHRPLLPGGDPLLRWQLVFLGVMLIGLPGVVNHFWWLNTIVDYVANVVVFSLGLVAVSTNPSYRRVIIRVLLGAFLFLAIWALLHNGVGPLNCWLEDENDLAGVLVVGLCLAYAIWAESPSAKWRWLAIMTGGLCIAGVIVTMSRGGFLALVATIAAIALLSGKLIRMTMLAGLLTLLALPFVPQSYLNEVGTIDDSANSYGKTDGQQMERIYTWRRSWEMFLTHPVLGVGAGNSSWAMDRFENTYQARVERGNRRQVAGRAIHSVYFTLLPELGIAGTLAYFTIIVLALRRVRQVLRRPAVPRNDASPRMLALFVGPALIGYSIAGIFISVLWYPMLWLLISLAIVMSAPSSVQPEAPEQQ